MESRPASMVTRLCGSCRHFQASPVRGLGWCRNPKLRDGRARLFVNRAELACDRKFGDYWDYRGDGPALSEVGVPRSTRALALAGASVAGAFVLLLCVVGLALGSVFGRTGGASGSAYNPPSLGARSAATATPTTGPSKLKVANTDGLGVYIRSEPNLSATRVAVWPDGTVLDVAGPDRSVDGKVWRNVRDSRGNAGWILAEYLLVAQ